MGLHININTDEGLSDEDINIIRAIADAISPSGSSKPAPSTAAGTSKPAAKKAAPAKPATPAKEEASDVDETSEADSDDTRTADDALKAAGALVSDGKAKHVKATLAEFGAGKVSELKDGQYGAFIDALNA